MYFYKVIDGKIIVSLRAWLCLFFRKILLNDVTFPSLLFLFLDIGLTVILHYVTIRKHHRFAHLMRFVVFAIMLNGVVFNHTENSDICSWKDIDILQPNCNAGVFLGFFFAWIVYEFVNALGLFLMIQYKIKQSYMRKCLVDIIYNDNVSKYSHSNINQQPPKDHVKSNTTCRILWTTHDH